MGSRNTSASPGAGAVRRPRPLRRRAEDRHREAEGDRRRDPLKFVAAPWTPSAWRNPRSRAVTTLFEDAVETRAEIDAPAIINALVPLAGGVASPTTSRNSREILIGAASTTRRPTGADRNGLRLEGMKMEVVLTVAGSSSSSVVENVEPDGRAHRRDLMPNNTPALTTHRQGISQRMRASKSQCARRIA